MRLLTQLIDRAGGGHSFSGGGGSSGGGSSFHTTGGGVSGTSTSGGGAGVFVLLMLIVVIIIVVVAVRKRGKGSVAAPGNSYVAPSTPAAPPPPPAPSDVSTGLDAIRAHDPGFEDDKFISDAERAFFTVQQAWTELKPEMSRRVRCRNEVPRFLLGGMGMMGALDFGDRRMLFLP